MPTSTDISAYMQRVLLAANQYEARALLGIPSVADTQTPWLGDEDAAGFYLRGLHDPTLAQDAATKAYVDGLGSGYVHNPATSDWDAGNHSITDLNSIGFGVGGVNIVNDLSSAIQFKHGSTLLAELTAGGNLSVENGILVPVVGIGSGSAIQDDGTGGFSFVDVDANPLLTIPHLGSGTPEFFSGLKIDDILLLGSYGKLYTREDNVGVILDTLVYDNQNASNYSGFAVDADIAVSGNLYLRNPVDLVTNSGVQFFSPAGTYDMGIAVATVGSVWNCAAGTGIMSFTAPQHYFGNTSDDGTSALVQVVGGLSLNDGGGASTYLGGTAAFHGDYTLASGDIVHVNRGFVMGFN